VRLLALAIGYYGAFGAAQSSARSSVQGCQHVALAIIVLQIGGKKQHEAGKVELVLYTITTSWVVSPQTG
jgi:hypothetical protein